MSDDRFTLARIERYLQQIACSANTDPPADATTTLLCYQNDSGDKFTRRETLIFEGSAVVDTIVDWLDSSGQTLTVPPVVTGLCEDQVPPDYIDTYMCDPES